MRKNMMRVISCVVTAAMVICMIPMQAIAYVADTRDQVTLHDPSGNSIVTDESWKETFPYGTFAFAESELKCREDGGERTVKIHRLGGTTGKADVTVSVTPVLTQLDDGSYSTAMAAGCCDYVLSVEDPLPIAEYQERLMMARQALLLLNSA